ncbi:MAG: hypothetical protein ACLPHP_07465 [Candidatus Sulfotelmatobacter sp.]
MANRYSGSYDSTVILRFPLEVGQLFGTVAPIVALGYSHFDT